MTMPIKYCLWLVIAVFLGLGGSTASTLRGQTITPSPFWKNEFVFPDDPFQVSGLTPEDLGWVKFTILLEPYDPNIVYYQDCQEYIFHYDFATECLDSFLGMTPTQYDQVTLYQQNQQAILGAVILPPRPSVPQQPQIAEYGIQFVRQDPFTREEIAQLFQVVKASIAASPEVVAFYFPSYEQLAVAQANCDWFADQGILVSSADRWATGNACYAHGWALGRLKYVPGDQIEEAYLQGDLLPSDILLTDGVPVEVPFVAGILSLAPSTPNSHVAILAQTFGIPFVHLALTEDADRAQQWIGHRIVVRAFEEYGVSVVRLIDVEGVLDQETINEILTLKDPPMLNIQPITPYGAYSASTAGLVPEDIRYFGGKAANFGMLRSAIPNNSPVALAFSFDLWNAFLDQPLTPTQVSIESGEYLLFWADEEEQQGKTHTNFRLSRNGNEDIGLFDTDGVTLLDAIQTFPPQGEDISYGRHPDGSDNWIYFYNGSATPGWSNSGGTGGAEPGLYINEFMADNDHFWMDESGEYDDWFELYNAYPIAIDLGGMYLTDDLNDPTQWQIPPTITGATLREEITRRLAPFDTYPPSDIAALSAELRTIRDYLFKNPQVTQFSQELQDAIINSLQDPQYGLDPNRNIRFRSSTNVEDSDQFTGAGLYDSYSGCLVDDLDADDSGPCLCDPNEPDERGVFRAIRKVFASFYNDNAFLERLRYGVNEPNVGMALLVHHSFPDEIELANGVATLEKRFGNTREILLVTQHGATPVTNPEAGALPEEVSVSVYQFGTFLTLLRYSNLLPLGDTVLQWEQEYRDLCQLLLAVADEFEVTTGKSRYILDFEYKKVASYGDLVVKQVREIPPPDDTPDVPTFLINEPPEFCVFQGEFGNVFANHRLKSHWRMATKNMWLNADTLNENFYNNVDFEYTAAGRLYEFTGSLSDLPGAKHAYDGTDVTETWSLANGSICRDYTLATHNIPTRVTAAQSPLLTVQDFGRLTLTVHYDHPVSFWDGIGPSTTTMDEIQLWPSPSPQPDDLLQERVYQGPNGVRITTSFYWPAPPQGVAAGYTAPLVHWVQTIIEGYTNTPIILEGNYSQTYRPEHHNFSEHFVFEPRLEPGISPGILDELRLQNIRLIHLVVGGISYATTYGFEDPPFVSADITGDGHVDTVDFTKFSSQWLESNCNLCSADFSGDGKVDCIDLQVLISQWLSNPSCY